MDSTGALYRCLTDPEFAHLDVHAHHVHLKNSLNRDKAEAIACKNIVRWLRDQGYEFEYTESTFDYSFSGALPWDIEICFCIGGFIAQKDRRIKYGAIGYSGGTEGGSADPKVRERVDKVFEVITASEHRDFVPAKSLYVVAHMLKEEIWFYLPEELRELVWYCRKPIYLEDEIKPCSRCHTCNYVKDKILKKNLSPN